MKVEREAREEESKMGQQREKARDTHRPVRKSDRIKEREDTRGGGYPKCHRNTDDASKKIHQPWGKTMKIENSSD